MRAETRLIINNYYDEDDKKLFCKFAKIIKNDYKIKDTHRQIWEYDQSLGGFGGYAAPLNPTLNPFNSLGDFRNVFRSLQYARSDMFYCTRPRHIIIDTALHVETLVKLVLSKNKLLKFIYNRREFGKNIEQLYKENIINNDLYERLNNLRKILNYAKHDTDPDRDNTFDYEDAIVFYFETRKVGNKLLKSLNYPTYDKPFEINEDI